jgi:uridine kinase
MIDSLLGIGGPSSEICILDGIFACHHSIRENLDLAVYVECSQKSLVHRTREIRRWLGDSSMAIDAMIEIAVQEEWPAIQQQSEFAHHVVCV